MATFGLLLRAHVLHLNTSTPEPYDPNHPHPSSRLHFHTLADGQPCLKSYSQISPCQPLWTDGLDKVCEMRRILKSRIMTKCRAYEKVAHTQTVAMFKDSGYRYFNSLGWSSVHCLRTPAVPLIIPIEVCLVFCDYFVTNLNLQVIQSMSTTVAITTGPNIVSLPSEIKIMIFSHLSDNDGDRAALALSCKSLTSAALALAPVRKTIEIMDYLATRVPGPVTYELCDCCLKSLPIDRGFWDTERDRVGLEWAPNWPEMRSSRHQIDAFIDSWVVGYAGMKAALEGRMAQQKWDHGHWKTLLRNTPSWCPGCQAQYFWEGQLAFQNAEAEGDALLEFTRMAYNVYHYVITKRQGLEYRIPCPCDYSENPAEVAQ